MSWSLLNSHSSRRQALSLYCSPIVNHVRWTGIYLSMSALAFCWDISSRKGKHNVGRIMVIVTHWHKVSWDAIMLVDCCTSRLLPFIPYRAPAKLVIVICVFRGVPIHGFPYLVPFSVFDVCHAGKAHDVLVGGGGLLEKVALISFGYCPESSLRFLFAVLFEPLTCDSLRSKSSSINVPRKNIVVTCWACFVCLNLLLAVTRIRTVRLWICLCKSH